MKHVVYFLSREVSQAIIIDNLDLRFLKNLHFHYLVKFLVGEYNKTA